MGGFIIVDDKHDIRNEMHERMSGRRVAGGNHMMGNREYEEGYRNGYEHGYRDHEHDVTENEHNEYRSTRYGRM